MLTAARILVIAILMLAPLPFGAVQPWAWGLLAEATAVAALLWAAACVRQGGVTLHWSAAYVAVLALLAVAAVQFLSQSSVDPIGTREAILKLVTYTLIFFLVQHLFADVSERTWQKIFTAVVVYAFAIAVFAVIQLFATPGLVYFTIKPRWAAYVVGPYVYHNAYAGLMEILIPISAAYIVGSAFRVHANAFRGEATTEYGKLVMFGFMVLTCIVSLFLSASRGGVIALALEFGLFAAVNLYLLSQREDDFGVRELRPARASSGITARRLPNSASLVLVVSFFVLSVATAAYYWLDTGFVARRFQIMVDNPEVALGNRDKITADTLRMAAHNLPRGIGLGSFQAAYPRYQTVAIDETLEFAHNDYAQFLAEGGIVGWILLPACVVGFLWHFWRLIHRDFRHRPVMYWVQVGAAIAACGIFVHSISDFNLHIPANAAWFAAAAALATLSPERSSSRILRIE
jgi:O-antigen ligase